MKTHEKKNATAKIIVLLLVVLSFLGIILSFFSFRASIKHVKLENFYTSLRIQTNQRLANMKTLIIEMVSDLEQISKAVEKYDNLTDPHISEILDFSNKLDWFDYTAVADCNGNGYDNCGNTFNIADQEYFQSAMQGNVSFSDVVPSRLTEGEYVQIIAYPLQSEEQETTGIVFGVLNLKSIESITKLKNSERNGEVYIIDSDGYYINCLHKNRSSTSCKGNFWTDLQRHTLENSDFSTIQNDFQVGNSGVFSYQSEGTHYYACYMPVGIHNWQLLFLTDGSSADALIHSLYSLNNSNTFFTAICIMVLILCIVWHFKISNREILQAHREATKNIDILRIAAAYSKHTIFDYDQDNKEIRLRTNTPNKLLDHAVISYVPESLIATHSISPGSIDAFRKLFDNIKTLDSCDADIQLSTNIGKIWYRISLSNIYDDLGNLVDTVGIAEDVTAIKEKEAAVKRKLELQETLIADALLYAKVDLSADRLLELNGKETALPFQNFLHEHIVNWVSDDHIPSVQQKLSLKSLNDAYDQGKESIEIQFTTKPTHGSKWLSCTVHRIHITDSSKVLFIITDIDQQKRKELTLTRQAEHDGLTGLYNSATIRSKVSNLLCSAQSTEEKQVLLLFDLDNFKLVNDTLGHSCGDQVLKDVAAILNSSFRSSDIIGRLGGDEFAVLLRNVKSDAFAEQLTNTLCQSLQRTYTQADKQVTISASIGVAIWPDDGTTFDELYKKADIALYQVKKGRKNGYKRFE